MTVVPRKPARRAAISSANRPARCVRRPSPSRRRSKPTALVLAAHTYTGKGSPTLAKRAEQVEYYRTHNPGCATVR